MTAKPDKPKNTVEPNTYQKPNLFVDELMRLLPPACNVLLDVATRQIMGWEKHRSTRRDRISLSQFRDFTGYSMNTIRSGLGILHAANILVPDGRPSLSGQEFELNLGQLGEYRLDYLASLPRRTGDISPAAAGLTARRSQAELPISGGGTVSKIDRAGEGVQNLTPSNDCNAPLAMTATPALQSLQTPNPKPIKESQLISLWEKVLASLRLEMPANTFETWLPSTRLVASDGGHHTISAPTQYAADWLTHRLARSVAFHLAAATGAPATIQFIVSKSTE